MYLVVDSIGHRAWSALPAQEGAAIMAPRRNQSNVPNQPEGNQPEASNQEAPVTTQTVEPTDQPTETQPESTEGNQPTEPKISTEELLATFERTVRDGIATADDTTGEVPLAPLSAMRDAYKALKGAARTKGSVRVGEIMLEQMMAKSEPGLRAVSFIQQNVILQPQTSGGSDKAPADPYAALVAQRVAISLASDLFASQPLPDGVDADELASRVSKRLDEVLGGDWNDEPNIAAVFEGVTPGDGTPAEVAAAFKIVQGKSAKIKSGSRATSATVTASGNRGDIGKHIVEVLSAKPYVALTVAEINKEASSEYPEGLTSGAVAARLAKVAAGKSKLPTDGTVTVIGKAVGNGDGKLRASFAPAA